MACFYRSTMVLWPVVFTVFGELTMCCTGKPGPSPIVSFSLKRSRNVTFVILPHGLSYKTDCRQSITSNRNASTNSPNLMPTASRHRRDTPSEEYSEYTVDVDNPTGVDFNPAKANQTVHLLTAQYVPDATAKQSCGTLDVVERLLLDCNDLADEHCLITANDPSTVSGCKRRSLSFEYYCERAGFIGPLMVDIMMDDN